MYNCIKTGEKKVWYFSELIQGTCFHNSQAVQTLTYRSVGTNIFKCKVELALREKNISDIF